MDIWLIRIFCRNANMMSDTAKRPKENTTARDPDGVLGTDKPDTVSAACWLRPYRYKVVRTDEGRLKAFDDHSLGRIVSSGLHTRHNAIGRRARLSRRAPPDTEYQIIAERNPQCDRKNKLHPTSQSS